MLNKAQATSAVYMEKERDRQTDKQTDMNQDRHRTERD